MRRLPGNERRLSGCLLLAIFVLLPKSMQSDPETIPVPDGTPIGEFGENKAVGTESPRPITTSSGNPPLNASASLRSHWPVYLMEAGEMALYMFLICTFATLLLHPTYRLGKLSSWDTLF